MGAGRKAAAAVASAAMLALAGTAEGSVWIANDASRPGLRVDARSFAEVDWTQGGARRTQLVPPRGEVLPGGHVATDIARAAAAPGVPFARVVRTTPDGTLWALQLWRPQPGGPLELHLASWTGAPTKLELSADSVRVTGRVTFHGRPVTGFSTTPAGKRLRIYVYLDCFRCPAGGSGWGRMLGVAPKADGTFAVRLRPEWTGTRYRASVAGPNLGATRAPDAQAVAAG